MARFEHRVAAGAVASLATIVPFAITRTDVVISRITLPVGAGVAIAATVLTLTTAATRSATRPPAIDLLATR